MTIYKYPIGVEDFVSVQMPRLAQVLCVQMQRGIPCIWALVDPDEIPEERRFRIYGIGHKVSGNGAYIGTFQIHSEVLASHLFEPLAFHLFEALG